MFVKRGSAVPDFFFNSMILTPVEYAVARQMLDEHISKTYTHRHIS